MARYEYSEGSSNKFWEIELHGASFTTRWGRIGTAGQSKTKDFASAEEAQKTHDKLLAEKLKEGYVPAGGPASSEGEPAAAPAASASIGALFEQAILERPEDTEARSIYGDWLQQQGDPRGELIALQAAASANPSDRRVQEQVEQYLKKHRPKLLGALEAFEKTQDGTAQNSFTWALGFIRRARLAYDNYAAEDEEDAKNVAEQLAVLLGHPSARFLEELIIGLNSEDGQAEYSGVIKTLCARPPPLLKSLFIADFEYPDQIEMSWTSLGDLSPLWPLLPRLETLIVQGGSFTLGALELPALRSAEFRTGGLSLASIRSICAARWPELLHLHLWFGDDNYGAEGGLEDIQDLLAAKGLGKLRRLGLMNAGFADALCEALARSAILPQLEVLDLSKSTLSDAGARFIAEHQQDFAHLKKLNVSECCLEEGARILRGVCPLVVSDGQRQGGDEDDRYVAVGE